jgi:hypothetical protein
MWRIWPAQLRNLAQPDRGAAAAASQPSWARAGCAPRVWRRSSSGWTVAYRCTVTLRQCCLGWWGWPPLVVEWICPSESIQKANPSRPGIVERQSLLVHPQSAGVPGAAALPAQVTSAWQYSMVTFRQAGAELHDMCTIVAGCQVTYK